MDHDNDDLAVFEGSAILSYLARRYDKEHRFSFAPDDNDYTRAEAWIGWQHGSVSPYQGQANHFVRFAKETIPYAMQRFVGETERVYGVLDKRLQDRDFVVGPGRGKYSIADIALLGWVNGLGYTTIPLDKFPSVKAWLARCWERPAVRRGFDVPSPVGGSSLQPPEGEEARKTEELRKVVDQAKEQYGYKYTSP